MIQTNKKQVQHERRRTRRRPILATFSLFVVVPQKGVHRLIAHDVSEDGIGFDLDIEGESFTSFNVNLGDEIDFRFYINPSLFIPLRMQVKRIEVSQFVRRLGGVFADKKSPYHEAFLSFLHFLDGILDAVQIEPQPGI